MTKKIILLIVCFALALVMPATAGDYQLSDELLFNEETDLDEPENAGFEDGTNSDNDELTSLWFDSSLVDNHVTFAGGSGTSDDPYLVENAAQLNKTRDDLTAHYRQIADIDLSGWSDGAGWNPIGYGDYNKFKGTYDGAGFLITNLTINRPGSSAQGLFGQTDGATIRAVNLKDVSLHGGFGTGALIGSMSSGTVDSVTVTGTIRGETNTVGGLVGRQGGGTIQNAAVHADVQGMTDVGGLVGSGGTQIRHSYTDGSVNGTENVGGLIGNLGHSTISDCYSRASVEGTDYVGGFIGKTEGWLGRVSRSYSTGPVNGTGTNVGGFQGGGTNNTQFCSWDTEASGLSTSWGGDGVAGKTTAEMQQQASYPAFNFYSLWTINEGNEYPIFQDLDRFDYTPLPDVNLDDLSGSGTLEDPYIITSAAELNAMRKDMTAYYRLNRDLDLTNSLVWNGGLGWAQIGSYNQRFRGGFDGGGHTIKNLTINRPYHHNDAGTGLIGGTEGATVHSIHLRNVAIQGDSRTGALIGDATSSTIRNTTVSGQVVTLSTMTGGLIGSLSGTLEQAIGGVSVIGGQETGGLVGRQAGGTIQNARVFADVQGATDVGGLAGSAGTQIRHSYAEGSVNGTENVGGLVGSLGHGTISDTYSRASVEGTDYVGGLIGRTEGWLGKVSRSYSTGLVTGTGTNVGGFQGGGTNNTQFCSWDTETSEQSTSFGGAGVAGKMTAEMQQQASYPAFNFYSLWSINEGDDYPTFQDLDRFDYTPLPDVNLDDLSGSGTPDDPYIITSAAELNAMRKNMTAYYRLNRDLDLTNSLIWNGGLGWAQVGSNTQRFRGGFDGGGHTIKNLTINRPYHLNDAGTGLIGGTEGATIHSIHLRNVAIQGDSRTGALIGSASSSTIRNTTVSGQVVTLSTMTGGLLGSLYLGTLEQASGEVSVIGGGETGGLVGRDQGGTITNSSVYATVQGTNDVGGLIGSGSGTNSRLYSNGTVIGVEDVGGLLGEWSGGTLSDTYSRATVNGTDGVGGLAGRVSGWTGQITRSYSTGAVNGTGENIGGLLGAGSAITSSYWDIDTSGQSTSAGGAGAMGRNTADMTYPYAADTYVDWEFGMGWAADTDYSKNDGYPYFDWSEPVPVPPVANFTVNATEGVAPLSVEFTDLSTGDPIGWAWYFGDEQLTASWTEVNSSAGWSGRTGHAAVTLSDGTIIVMGGLDSNYQNKRDVWRSIDGGVSWELVTAAAGWSGRQYHTAVAMPDDSIVLMGGYDGAVKNDVWRSEDNGATWIQLTQAAGWSARFGHGTAVLPDGSIVLTGGFNLITRFNDVWRSTTNGETWMRMTADAGWTSRYGHSSLTLPDGSLLVIGGRTGQTGSSEVWRSTDNGTSWTSVTADAGWETREGHVTVLLPDASILLTGGWHNDLPEGYHLNDTWRSTTNGATWTQVSESSGWQERQNHASVVLPDGTVVLMGGSTGSEYQNDVWQLQTAGSTEENPVHTYTREGVFDVTLRAFNAAGFDTLRRSGYITVTGSQAPVANFTAEPTSGYAPLTVQFNDTSTGNPTTWSWNFGDGNTSSIPNPSHIYTMEGIFNVSLNVSNAAGSDTITQENLITITAHIPEARFDLNRNFAASTENDTFIPGSYLSFQTYRLHAENLDDTTVLGDLTYVAGVANITSVDYDGYATWNATYAEWNFPSDYRIGPGSGFDTRADTSYTEVRTFTHTVTRNSSPVLFTAPGIQETNISVIFDDLDFESVFVGFASAKDHNMTTEIINSSVATNAPLAVPLPPNGTYHLKLDKSALTTGTEYYFRFDTTIIPNGSDVMHKPIAYVWEGQNNGSEELGVATKAEIPASMLPSDASGFSVQTNTSCNWSVVWQDNLLSILKGMSVQISTSPIANFTANRTLGSAPLAVAFTDLSTGNPTSWSWQFGDGTNSTERDPIHPYTLPGAYTVQLRVENSAGGSTMISEDYITVLPQASDMIIGAGSLNVATGMTGAIPVSITNVTGAEEIMCSVTVNPVYANFTGVAVNASVAGGTNLTYQINNNTGTLNVTLSRTDGNYTAGTEPVQILDITLQAKHLFGESHIDFGEAMWIRNDVEIPFGRMEAGILDIHLRCDFNQNNRIDIGDVAKVAWMAAGLVEEDLEADFDGDGHVTGADAARIAYYYVGKIGEL
ncbi:PKD domain-containing protein [Methanocalculus taiwanensis]|uniref:PKD domain-containing protein n=1 Tax=Methanocalculus taiwanensis TaxID=106207 RepID=A0ABD4TM78_9EURY|nr:PKD domain-containing protein [Methanocalculus taiwanensis]MCQ1539531.1 PKD domain-containing protein [Methanocalculus taiwanensis]